MSIELDFLTSQGRQQLCIGPLACDLDAFIVRLVALGYTRMTVRTRSSLSETSTVWWHSEG